ncbi:TIR domain-containing protein [Trebonia kvetii]|uniref:TIR domain-containing protein n=1 Tax=Trebonia kvetii TaxID=2480626 RepID=A0A6P2BM55_9ACTN|nr:TIR domain-containing protein [Trebonia kvetii]TVZ00018.1 TIR domain-containing protein [Trebonia kvetii]
MLRIARGWTALGLSLEYEKIGVGPRIERTAIAKIENGRRMIKAGEVEGISRVFGLRASDLLAPDGPRVFLSYADVDRNGEEVATWLSGRGFQVGRRQESEREGFSSAEPDEINSVQAFVALFSPRYFSSPLCREELDLAMKRKHRLQVAGVATEFIYVMRMAETHELDVSDLESYPVTDLTLVSGRNEEATLSNLGSKLMMSARMPSASRERR